MQLVVNGEEQQVEQSTTVKQLLASLGLADTLVAVERSSATKRSCREPGTKAPCSTRAIGSRSFIS